MKSLRPYPKKKYHRVNQNEEEIITIMKPKKEIISLLDDYLKSNTPTLEELNTFFENTGKTQKYYLMKCTSRFGSKCSVLFNKYTCINYSSISTYETDSMELQLDGVYFSINNNVSAKDVLNIKTKEISLKYIYHKLKYVSVKQYMPISSLWSCDLWYENV